MNEPREGGRKGWNKRGGGGGGEDDDDDDEQEQQEKKDVHMMTGTQGHEFFSKLTPMVLI